MTAPTFALTSTSYVDPTEVVAVEADAGRIRVLLRTSGVWLDASDWTPKDPAPSLMVDAVGRLRTAIAQAVAAAQIDQKGVTTR